MALDASFDPLSRQLSSVYQYRKLKLNVKELDCIVNHSVISCDNRAGLLELLGDRFNQ